MVHTCTTHKLTHMHILLPASPVYTLYMLSAGNWQIYDPATSMDSVLMLTPNLPKKFTHWSLAVLVESHGDITIYDHASAHNFTVYTANHAWLRGPHQHRGSSKTDHLLQWIWSHHACIITHNPSNLITLCMDNPCKAEPLCLHFSVPSHTYNISLGQVKLRF